MPWFPIVSWGQGSPLRGSTSGHSVSPSLAARAALPRHSAPVTPTRETRGRTAGARRQPELFSGTDSAGGSNTAMRIYEASITYNLVQLGDSTPLNRPELVPAYLKTAFETHPTQESFWVILLDRKNRPIGRVMISLGTLTSTLVHPREVLRAAILGSAAAIIVAHNHPSGDPAPSAADVQATRQLREACRAVDIDLLDHVVVGYPEADPRGRGFYSFREAGVL